MNKRMRELLAQASSRPLEAVNQMNSTESDMNKRMRELAFEANKDLDGNMPIGFAEKFAELIVRECADVIRKEVSMKFKDGGETGEFMGGHYAGSVLARVKIKQHFGIE